MNKNKKLVKNIIIRSSFSELPNGELKSNFGDLIRSTILLNCIDENYLWLTDERSVNLLKWFVDPKKMITFEDGIKRNSLRPDLNIYNMDNYTNDLQLFSKIKGEWHGYIPDGKGLKAENKHIMGLEPYAKSSSKLSWQESLVKGMGFQWKKQDYALPRIKNKIKTDVGLNWQVHPDWKSKQWPESYWKELEHALTKIYTVSWQKGLNDFDEYINWISSCKLIVTCDTLGLHLASALRKKVVAISGATGNREFPYNRVVFVKPSFRDCMPCNLPKCREKKHCLDEISAERVSKTIFNAFSGNF